MLGLRVAEFHQPEALWQSVGDTVVVHVFAAGLQPNVAGEARVWKETYRVLAPERTSSGLIWPQPMAKYECQVMSAASAT